MYQLWNLAMHLIKVYWMFKGNWGWTTKMETSQSSVPCGHFQKNYFSDRSFRLVKVSWDALIMWLPHTSPLAVDFLFFLFLPSYYYYYYHLGSPNGQDIESKAMGGLMSGSRCYMNKIIIEHRQQTKAYQREKRLKKKIRHYTNTYQW